MEGGQTKKVRGTKARQEKGGSRRSGSCQSCSIPLRRQLRFSGKPEAVMAEYDLKSQAPTQKEKNWVSQYPACEAGRQAQTDLTGSVNGDGFWR